MKIAYDTRFNPPAPALSVQISNLDDVVRSPTLPALVDSGADTTVIPAAMVQQLGLTPAGETLVRGYEGQPESVPMYDIILRVAEARLVGLSAVTFSADYILLGRDALNWLRLLLDGPALTLEILPPT
jgi:hypothetical protein